MYFKFTKKYDSIKSFKQFLNEVNFGSLEKDTRIKDITKSIKKDILDSKKFKGTIYSNIITKNKDPNKIEIIVNWKFNIRMFRNEPDHFCFGAGFSDGKYKNEYNIEIDIGFIHTTSDDQIHSQIENFVNSDKIDEFLFHEVKHLCDRVDGNFKSAHYISSPHNTEDIKGITKYISQDKEIDNQLISVLGELGSIKKKNPDISFNEAIKISSAYEQFIQYIIPSKLKKYKQKIIHFWYSSFEK